MFPRTLASPVLHLGQFVALYTVVAEETCVSRELKKPRDRGGSLSGHNNDEAAFCQMITRITRSVSPGAVNDYLRDWPSFPRIHATVARLGNCGAARVRPFCSRGWRRRRFRRHAAVPAYRTGRSSRSWPGGRYSAAKSPGHCGLSSATNPYGSFFLSPFFFLLARSSRRSNISLDIRSRKATATRMRKTRTP